MTNSISHVCRRATAAFRIGGGGAATVAFVEDVEAMVDVVKFYASNETARAERARRAAAVLKARRFAAALRGPVEDLVLGSCRFWRAADVGDAEAWRWRVASAKREL